MSAEAAAPAALDFYGATVSVESADPDLLKRLSDDFPAFAAASPTREREHLAIRAERSRPDYDALPPLLSTVHTRGTSATRTGASPTSTTSGKRSPSGTGSAARSTSRARTSTSSTRSST